MEEQQTTPNPPKRKQNQPKTQASKAKPAVKLRRKKIIKAILAGKTHQEAGIIAGFKAENASSQVSKTLRETPMQDALMAAFDKLGLDDAGLAQQHYALMEGKRYVPARGDDEGCPEARGYIAVPDLAAKAKAVEMLYKLKGKFIDKHEVDMKQPVKIVIKKFCSRGAKPVETVPEA